jgi:hypothetical protein
MFAFVLAQGGEFAFLLFSFATQNRVVSLELSNLLIVVVVLTMAITPLLIIVYDRLIRPRFIDCVSPPEDAEIDAPESPVIVAGYGRFGQVVSRLLTADGIGTTLLDHDSSQIELTGRFGYKVFFGDATRVQLLQAAGAEEAKLLVVAIDDRDKAVQMVQAAKQFFPEEALKLLGYDDARAYRVMRTFKRHDEEGLLKLYEVWGDDHAYGLRVRQHTEQLEKVLKDDSDDAELHFREAWKHLQGAETKREGEKG